MVTPQSSLIIAITKKLLKKINKRIQSRGSHQIHNKNYTSRNIDALYLLRKKNLKKYMEIKH